MDRVREHFTPSAHQDSIRSRDREMAEPHLNTLMVVDSAQQVAVESQEVFGSLGFGDILPPQRPTIRQERLDLQFGSNVHIALNVDAGPGCGGIAWPAGEVLSRYLAEQRGSLAGHTVLELGSGTGLCGLVAARLGATAIITDQSPLLETMRSNVKLNDLGRSVSVVELNWGEPIPREVGPLDNISIVLAADCVYFEPAFPLLVETLETLSSTSKTIEFLFCYKKRRKADARFFKLLKKSFNWDEVNDPRRTEYSREAISLFRLLPKSKHRSVKNNNILTSMPTA